MAKLFPTAKASNMKVIDSTGSAHSARSTVHYLRLVAAFALLGAVVAGIITSDNDSRLVGAIIGACVAIGAQAFDIL
jgi:hypothetical protein